MDPKTKKIVVGLLLCCICCCLISSVVGGSYFMLNSNGDTKKQQTTQPQTTQPQTTPAPTTTTAPAPATSPPASAPATSPTGEPIPTKRYFMYGPWIENNNVYKQVNEVSNVGSNKVYMIEDGIYTKMVLDNGSARYFEGSARTFDASKWSTYTDASTNYKLRVCPYICSTGCNEKQEMCTVSPANDQFISNVTAGRMTGV